MFRKSKQTIVILITLIITSLACSISGSPTQAPPITQVIQVTQIVPVTQAPPIIQIVPVTQIVLVTQEPSTYQARIFANQGWQNTGINISLGDIVTVEYISGTWTGGIGPGRWYDGRGDLIERYKCAEKVANPSTCKEPMPYVYNGALIGKVGDILVEIGNYSQFISATGGNLQLRMNDHDEGLFDNDGSIIVRVSVQH